MDHSVASCQKMSVKLTEEQFDEWNISCVIDVSRGNCREYRSAHYRSCHWNNARLAQRFMGAGERVGSADPVNPGIRPDDFPTGPAGCVTHRHRHIAPDLWAAMAAQSHSAGSGFESQAR